MIDYEIGQLRAALPRAFRRRRDPAWLPPRLEERDVPDFDIIRIEGRLSDREIDSIDALLSDAAGAGRQTFDDAAGLVGSGGWEAIAWYSPFHFQPHQGEWGIYVREDAIWSAVFDLYGLSERSLKRSALFRMLLDSTLAHERFHFRMEVFTSISEGILRRPRYLRYTDVVYKPSWPAEACIEESLATAMAIRSIDDRVARELLRKYFSSAPPAYKNFERFDGRKSYVEGIKVLVGQAIQASAAPNNTNQYLVGNFASASFRELPNLCSQDEELGLRARRGPLSPLTAKNAYR
jgi:hypothetical protein